MVSLVSPLLKYLLLLVLSICFTLAYELNNKKSTAPKNRKEKIL
jgi:hypothetical protein